MEKEFSKKEFDKWFIELEKIAKDEYRITNLKKKDFLEQYKKGKTFSEAIETFLYE